jgi:site-specific recombinase XerD
VVETSEEKKGRVLPKILAKDDVRKLLKEPSRRYPTGLRNYVMMAVMYRAGLRVQELLDLKPSDIDGIRSVIRVNQGKGNKDRHVPVEPWIIDAIGQWKVVRETIVKKYTKSEPYLFLTLKGTQVIAHYMREMIRREAEHAGIAERVTPHMLRHSYATELLDENFTIREVQDLLGHADISTTMIYTHVSMARMAEKVAKRAM